MTAQRSRVAGDASHHQLAAALEVILRLLEAHVASVEKQPYDISLLDNARRALEEIEAGLTGETPLRTLCAAFGLSPFERDLLLLCAGLELESRFATACARLRTDHQAVVTFSLALAALPDAHWSAASLESPLRYWRLIEVGTGSVVTMAPLRIDERILHFLTGLDYPDERLAGVLEPAGEPRDLVPSQSDCMARIARIWENYANGESPIIQLVGPRDVLKQDIAAAVCRDFGLDLWILPARNLPASAAETDLLRRIWDRETALAPRALLLDCDRMDDGNPAQERSIDQFINGLSGPLFLSTTKRRPEPRRRLSIPFDAQPAQPDEQRSLWAGILGSRAADLAGEIDRLVYQFDMNAAGIRSACAAASAAGEEWGPKAVGRQLWDMCRLQARPMLDSMVQRLDPSASWDDVVLPDRQAELLRGVAAQVRERATVYGAWGFQSRGDRGQGISALFAGPSGTGKTLAAEVLAGELRLDLYRIDLSTVVNKYIGETEKNLRRLFEAAESGGAILLFDEADALFGKRSEVRDSHDRYANIEVSYLLQRMETYRGLAILTTNLKDNLDPAFLRRLRFIVDFPFPDAQQRARIWERIFPAAAPVEGLDTAKLARLNVTGAEIRNIALHAAFLAATQGGPVTMALVRRAAHSEYGKLGRTLTESEVRGWV